jgi:hypothetical protein
MNDVHDLGDDAAREAERQQRERDDMQRDEIERERTDQDREARARVERERAERIERDKAAEREKIERAEREDALREVQERDEAEREEKNKEQPGWYERGQQDARARVERGDGYAAQEHEVGIAAALEASGMHMRERTDDVAMIEQRRHQPYGRDWNGEAPAERLGGGEGPARDHGPGDGDGPSRGPSGDENGPAGGPVRPQPSDDPGLARLGAALAARQRADHDLGAVPHSRDR